MPPSEPKVRLFVALDPTAEARNRLAQWRDEAFGQRADLRLLAPESLHLTLAFIGYRPEGEVGEIGAAALEAVRGLPPALLRPRGVTGVPPRRPRLFALDLEDEDGRATAIAAAVSDALEAGGWYEPEKRPFWPHVTLARVRRGARVREVAIEPPSEPIAAAEVTLYRSLLSPRGARYEPLAKEKL